MKILVGGHFNSGKTTFVKTITRAISTEKRIFNEEERKKKEYTTVAMDYGTYSFRGEKINIFGIPGQERFSFMWKVLAKGVSGYIFMLDSADPDMWKDTLKQIELFMQYNEAPYIVAANKQDLENAMSIEHIAQKTGIDRRILIPCIAYDEDHVKRCLGVLLTLIKEVSRGVEV